MTAYKLKKGYTDDINRIQDIIFKCVGVNTKIVNNKIIFNYQFLKKIIVYIQNKKLYIETEKSNDININNEEILAVNSLFRKFLYLTTGYTLKERIKNLKNE